MLLKTKPIISLMLLSVASGGFMLSTSCSPSRTTNYNSKGTNWDGYGGVGQLTLTIISSVDKTAAINSCTSDYTANNLVIPHLMFHLEVAVCRNF